MFSRRFAHFSTGIHVRCLNFRVRKESWCDTPAVAAIESQDPELNRSRVALQATAWPLRHPGRIEITGKFSILAFQNFVWV